ncbi:Uncharacterised protein [Mycobacterium tuberculosis]|nr:Uncharacterised protein [Mycobacterium tuberculosis]
MPVSRLSRASAAASSPYRFTRYERTCGGANSSRPRTRRCGSTPTFSPRAVSTCACDLKCCVRLATTILAWSRAACSSVSRWSAAWS